MTREEWALAYILRFGVDQLCMNEPPAQGEEEFKDQYTAAFGLPMDYESMMRDMFETLDLMGIERPSDIED